MMSVVCRCCCSVVCDGSSVMLFVWFLVMSFGRVGCVCCCVLFRFVLLLLCGVVVRLCWSSFCVACCGCLLLAVLC